MNIHTINHELNPRPHKKKRQEVSPLWSGLPCEIFSKIYSMLRFDDLLNVKLTERVQRAWVNEYITLYFFEAVCPDHFNLCLKGYIEGKCNANNLNKFLYTFEKLALCKTLNNHYRQLVANDFNRLLDTAVERQDWELIPDLILASRHICIEDEDERMLVSIPWALFHYVISDYYSPELLTKIFYIMFIEHSKNAVFGLFPLLWASGRTLTEISPKKRHDSLTPYSEKISECTEKQNPEGTIGQLEKTLEGKFKCSLLVEQVALNSYPYSHLLWEKFTLSEIEKCLIENTPESLNQVSEILIDIKKSQQTRWHVLMTKAISLIAKFEHQDLFHQAVDLTVWTTQTKKERMYYLGYGRLKGAGKERLSNSYSRTLSKGNPYTIKNKYQLDCDLAKMISGSRGLDRLNSLPALNGKVEYTKSLLCTSNTTLKLAHLMNTKATPWVENELMVQEEYRSNLSETLTILRDALATAKLCHQIKVFDQELHRIFGKYAADSKIPFYFNYGTDQEASTMYVIKELSPMQTGTSAYAEVRNFVARRLSQAYFWGGHSAQIKLIKLIQVMRGSSSLLTALFFHHATQFQMGHSPVLEKIGDELLNLDCGKYLEIMNIWSHVKFISTWEAKVALNKIRNMFCRRFEYEETVSIIYLKTLIKFLTNQPKHFNLFAHEAFRSFQYICSLRKTTDDKLALFSNFFKALSQAQVDNTDLKTNLVNGYYQELIRFLGTLKLNQKEEVMLKLYQLGVLKAIDLKIRMDCPLTEE